MKFARFIPRPNWRLLAAAPVAIGVLHIVATFAAPSLSGPSAVRHLAGTLPLNAMKVLPALTPTTQPLPFLAPDARYAMCRFETGAGQVAVRATLPEPGWILTVYDDRGTSVFSATPAGPERLDLYLALVPADDRFAGLTPEARGIEQQQARAPLNIGIARGLVAVRAPDKGFAYAAANLAELAKAACEQKAY